MERDPTKAYQEAERRIAAVRESGRTWLDLGDLMLAQLPPSLGELTSLRALSLGAEKLESETEAEMDDARLIFEGGDYLRMEIDDLSVLTDLTELRLLSFSFCQIKNVKVLSALTSLQSLDCHHTQIDSLGPLADLLSLQSLDCNNTQIDSLGPLADLKRLQSLSCDRTQIDSLEPLSDLKRLQSLTCSGTQIDSLEPLADLERLQSLDCSFTQIDSLEPLADLKRLQSLYCSGTQIDSLEPLADLKRLELLSCDSTQIDSLGPLADLKRLQSLYCFMTQIDSLEPLADLKRLQLLSCEYTQIDSLEPLADLLSLQSLTCSGTQIDSLEPLADLKRLQSLTCFGTQIDSLEPLADLRSLQSLTCSNTQIDSLEPLADFRSLQSLTCSNTQIDSLGPLADLRSLQSLTCSNTQIESLEPIRGLDHLGTLNIFGNQTDLCGEILEDLPALRDLETDHFPRAPREVLSTASYDNCLPRLRAWLADLVDSEQDDRQIKAFVLGNGEAGKTQLCRFLAKEPFDPDIPSTHGVQVLSFPVELGEDEEPVCLNLWDFGGQDIYLSTHALFLEGRSLVLLCWTPELEERGEYEHEGLSFRAHRLPYWAAYVRGLTGTDNPVVVTQTRCRQQKDRVNPPPADFSGFDFAPPVAFYRKDPAVEGDRDLGHESVIANLKDGVRFLFETQGVYQIGKSRAAIREELRRRRSVGTTTIPLSEFETLCADSKGISSAEYFLDYLHRTGEVFYRRGLFGDDIILDQAWALRAVYTVFDRKNAYRLLGQDGIFTRSLLDGLVWGEYDEDEQKLFLSLMERCGVCFPNHPNTGKEDPEHETQYIAPDLLPEVGRELDRFRRQPEVPGGKRGRLEFRYPFLHDGIFRQLMCDVGRRVGESGRYWKNAFTIYERSSQSEAFLWKEMPEEEDPEQPGAGRIQMEAAGRDPRRLLEVLAKTLREIRIGEEPEIEGFGAAENFSAASERSRFTGPDEDSPERKEPGLEHQQFGHPPPPPGQEPEIFVSYAWGEDSSEEGRRREEIVDRLCDRLKEEDREVIRDKTHMRHGNLISDFMYRIGKGDRVIVVISDKYLKSAYCMNELHQVYSRAAGNKAEFLERIIPLVMDEVKIGEFEERAVYSDHWMKRYEDRRESLKSRMDDADPEDFREWQLMKNFQSEVLKMLKYIQDDLMPRGFDAVIENDFQAVIDRIPPKSAGK